MECVKLASALVAQGPRCLRRRIHDHLQWSQFCSVQKRRRLAALAFLGFEFWDFIGVWILGFGCRQHVSPLQPFNALTISPLQNSPLPALTPSPPNPADTTPGCNHTLASARACSQT